MLLSWERGTYKRSQALTQTHFCQVSFGPNSFEGKIPNHRRDSIGETKDTLDALSGAKPLQGAM